MLDNLQGIRGSSVSTPFNVATAGNESTVEDVSFPDEDITRIVSSGFTRTEAIEELKKCNGDADKALVQLLARALTNY